MLELFQKIIKFGIVGFTGAFLDFGITYALKDRFKVHKYVANAMGFMFAASSNYVLNRLWTFQSKNEKIFLEYGQFLLVSIIGLMINSLILWIFVSRFKKHFYLSKFFALIFTASWNFIANALITFH